MMKKLLLNFLLLVYALGYTQTVLLDEDFENYPDFIVSNIGQWKTMDQDFLYTWTFGDDPAPPVNWVANWPNAGIKMAYQIFNPSQANVSNDATGITGEMRNFDPHSGEKYAACWAGKMTTTGHGNNDWLISPAVVLGSSGNTLKLWVKTLSLSYGNERYRIGVYLGNGTPASASDFTIISTPENYSLAPATWTELTYNLDAYNSQTVRIGVQCVTQEGSMLMIDDVSITTTGEILDTQDVNTYNEFKIYPNPTHGMINVQSPKKIEKYEVFSLDGKRLLKKKYKSKKIDLSALISGHYLIEFSFSDGTILTKKITKI